MYIKTSEKIQVNDYPYSFNTKTTLFDSLEFHPKKGYRHVTQTVNPKTGKLNNPKKGTYYALLVRLIDEHGQIKTAGFDFNGREEINRGCKFVGKNFNLFSSEEVEYLYITIMAMGFADFKAAVVYGGSEIEALKPLYEPLFNACKKGLKTKENTFGSMSLDIDAIEATKPKDFNPFVVTHSGPIQLG